MTRLDTIWLNLIWLDLPRLDASLDCVCAAPLRLSVLEREPELRAEIEEEIKNNNWGY